MARDDRILRCAVKLAERSRCAAAMTRCLGCYEFWFSFAVGGEFEVAFEAGESLGGVALALVHGFFDRLDFDFERSNGLAALSRGVRHPGEDAEANGGEHGVEGCCFHKSNQ